MQGGLSKTRKESSRYYLPKVMGECNDLRCQQRGRVNIRMGEGMLNSSHHKALVRLPGEAEESPSSNADQSRLDKSLPGMTYL